MTNFSKTILKLGQFLTRINHYRCSKPRLALHCVEDVMVDSYTNVRMSFFFFFFYLVAQKHKCVSYLWMNIPQPLCLQYRSDDIT